jgi:hypothetical protein
MVGVATGASFRRGERAFLSGHYFAAEVAAPAGYGWERRKFGRWRLLRHTRTMLMLRMRGVEWGHANWRSPLHSACAQNSPPMVVTRSPEMAPREEVMRTPC